MKKKEKKQLTPQETQVWGAVLRELEAYHALLSARANPRTKKADLRNAHSAWLDAYYKREAALSQLLTGQTPFSKALLLRHLHLNHTESQAVET